MSDSKESAVLLGRLRAEPYGHRINQTPGANLTRGEVEVIQRPLSENRLNYVFINFLLAVATNKHPLVLFLDHLLWIGAASLMLDVYGRLT